MGALPDFSLEDSILTKVNTAARGLVDPTATVTRTAQDVRDRNIRWSFGRLKVRKNVDTIGRLLGRTPPGSDASSTAHRPEEVPAERPEENPGETPKKKWNTNLKKLLRRRGSDESIFKQPPPFRKGPSMSHSSQASPQGYEVLPDGRIARMSALEGHSEDAPSHHGGSQAAAAGSAAASRKRWYNDASSDEFGGSQESYHRTGILRSPSLRSMASPQSEMLPFFKDYYSQDDIHPGDRVAVLGISTACFG